MSNRVVEITPEMTRTDDAGRPYLLISDEPTKTDALERPEKSDEKTWAEIERAVTGKRPPSVDSAGTLFGLLFESVKRLNDLAEALQDKGFDVEFIGIEGRHWRLQAKIIGPIA